MGNLLKAIKNIVENPITKVTEHYAGRNRANAVGYALENYIKDVFANTVHEENENKKLQQIGQVFSYLGNQNNPPDMMLLNGDAIEVKKIQSPKSSIALNSSYPKAKLFADSPMLTKACKESEIWSEKDIIYVVGCTSDTDIKYLWLVYGNCFVAEKSVYERIKNTITAGINSLPDIEFAKTKELGGIKKIDPLGVTDLRIRGMWDIENPYTIFSYLNCIDSTAKFEMVCLMTSDKFDSFPELDKSALFSLQKSNYKMDDVEIKNPNNPAQLMKAKLITFKVY